MMMLSLSMDQRHGGPSSCFIVPERMRSQQYTAHSGFSWISSHRAILSSNSGQTEIGNSGQTEIGSLKRCYPPRRTENCESCTWTGGSPFPRRTARRRTISVTFVDSLLNPSTMQFLKKWLLMRMWTSCMKPVAEEHITRLLRKGSPASLTY